jgi:hypothetical protein
VQEKMLVEGTYTAAAVEELAISIGYALEKRLSRGGTIGGNCPKQPELGSQGWSSRYFAHVRAGEKTCTWGTF